MQLYNPSKCIQSESPTHPSLPPITPQMQQFIKWMLKLMVAFISWYHWINTVYNTVEADVEVIIEVKRLISYKTS